MNVHDVSLLVDTYICEQIRFPPIRNKIRTKILDEHLENTLRIVTTRYQTRYEKFACVFN